MSVYFIIAREVGRVKIGRAGNVATRFGSIQTSCPVPVTLERLIEGGKPEEAELHRRFAHLRRHGEWFELTGELEAFMETLPRPPQTRQPQTLEDRVPGIVYSVRELMEALGGATAVSRALDIPKTTAHAWMRSDHVPHWRHGDLLTLARARGITLHLEDKAA